MPLFVLFGLLVGLVLGGIGFFIMLTMLGTVVPAILGPIFALLAPILGLLPLWFTPWIVIALAMIFQILCSLIAYSIATRSIAPLLPAATGLATVTFPLAGKLGTPGGAVVIIPATTGEFFGRGMLIGLSASTNALMLSLLPGGGAVLAVWAFVIIVLSGIRLVAISRIYQGLLGWSGWLFPLSYLATAVGMLLFGINLLFSLPLFGPRAASIDWTTGVIESNLAIPFVTFNGGFSLGNFTFLSGTAVTTPASTFARFITPGLSPHETGHSLNTAALGGIVLWINAIDENIFPRRMNLAYGELTAEGHSNNLPGTRTPDYSVLFWF